jgi:hypothetical protein
LGPPAFDDASAVQALVHFFLARRQHFDVDDSPQPGFEQQGDAQAARGDVADRGCPGVDQRLDPCFDCLD